MLYYKKDKSCVKIRKAGIIMNGIDYSSLLGNTNFFSNQAGTVQGDKKYQANVPTGKKDNSVSRNADYDTVEINGYQPPKAGYTKPKAVKPESPYKPLDSNGIQEGIELSDKAKKLLAQLREKYGNMEISVAKWSSDEEQDYYAKDCKKDYSVLIDPEALEKMAADEDVRAQYESVLDQAGGNSKALKEALGEDADKIESFQITIGADGKVSFAVKLIKDFEERNANKTEKSEKEKLEEKREEARRKEKERLEKVAADSIEELIQKIKDKLYPQEKSEDVVVEETPNLKDA